MTDYELGYQHGYNDGKYCDMTYSKYPNNLNYAEGFRDGSYARVYMPDSEDRYYIGENSTNDTMPD